MEETISLKEIFDLLKNKIGIIISMLLFGICISFLITFFLITPKYSSGAQLIVSSKNSDNNLSTDNINSNLLMINTYKDFIKGRVVTDAASKELEEKKGYKYTSDDIENMLSIEQTQNSQMFTVKVTSTNPEAAAAIVNVVAEIFKDQASEYTSADKVAIISPAETSNKPVSPNKKINVLIGGLLGLIIGIGLALLSQLFNKTINSSDYVLETLKIPILGTITLVDDKEIKRIKKEQFIALKVPQYFIDSFETNILYGDNSDGLDADEKRLNERDE